MKMRRLKLVVLLGSAALTSPGWALEPEAASAAIQSATGARPAIESETAASPALLLAEVYGSRTHPALYWVSEKLDGVRAVWDGHVLRFRSGRRVQAPAWFLAALPPAPLDGELWLGRGRFDELSGIVRKASAVDTEWRQVRYMIFELPPSAGALGDATGDTYTERLSRIQDTVSKAGVPWLQAVEHFRVSDQAALMQAFDAVVAAAGEGLMLHRADAPYLAGRSDALQKLKPMLDAEATVVGYAPGRGRLKGSVGALQLKAADGKRFRVSSGLTDAERRNPPPVGSLVTYRYQSLSKHGIPRFPRYWRREAL